MVNLIAKTPCDGLLPVEIGDVRLSELVPDAITWISPFKGKDKAVSQALKDAQGMAFPAPNRSTGKATARAIWCGPDQALVLGPPVDIAGAAIVDQSDGWAVIVIEGAGTRDVLARLVPIDLGEAGFKRNHTARTLLNHMTCCLTRTGPDRFEIMVMRSMAKTAANELCEAMELRKARA